MHIENGQRATLPETLLAPVPACLTEPVLVQIFLVPTAQPERKKCKYVQFHCSKNTKGP